MFKYKDLYIILAPQAATHAHGCAEENDLTIHAYAQPGGSTTCCEGTISLPPRPILAWITRLAVDPGPLGDMTLKDYLKLALNEQVTLSEMQVPEAIHDLPSALKLEHGLSGALEAVRARRAELELNV